MTDRLPNSSDADDAVWGPEGPPWLQSHQSRRDCDPHRGELLGRLAALSRTLGLLAVCAWLCFPLVPYLAGLGTILGGATWFLAHAICERCNWGVWTVPAAA